MSSDARFDHIDQADKQKVVKECMQAENWLREMKQYQDVLPKNTAPVLFSEDIKKKAEALDWFCKPIMMKPKPAPAKPQSPPPTEVPAQQDEEPSSTESMDVETPDESVNPAS